MPDEFVPESTKYFGASMRHVSRRDREKVHGKAVLVVMGRSLAYILVYPFRVLVHLALIFAGTILGLLSPILYSQMFMDNVLLRKPIDPARYETLPQSRFILGLTRAWQASGPDVLLVVVLVGLAIVAIVGVARGLFTVWWDNNLKNRIVHRLRTTLMGRFLGLSLRFHTSQRVGDIIFRVQNDTSSVTGFYQRAIMEPWSNVLSLATRLFSMIALNWILTLVAFSVFPFVLTLNLALIMPLRRAARRSREANSDLMSKIEGTFGAIKAVVAFGRENEENAHYRDLSWHALDWQLRMNMWRSVLEQSVMETLNMGRYALIFFGAYAVWNEWMTIGQWGVLNSYFWGVHRPIVNLTRTWTNLQTLLVGMDRVFTSMDLQPEIKERPGARQLPPIREELEFRNVTCEYDKGRPVLRNICLKAKTGTVTALVGTVGSGKSTLVSCVPRFIDPIEGQVLLDGVDIREFTLKSLREHVALALQENQLFSTSILENILYGSKDGYRGAGAWRARGDPRQAGPRARGQDGPPLPGALRLEDLNEALRKDLLDATRAACLESFVAGLPRKFNTHVGERASRLSGGEKQRIAVARAFIRKTPILILDEPTASLDAETEAELLYNLKSWGKNRIIFIVAHRLATVRQADQICFMKEGQILESGPHDELVKIPGGYYRDFYEMQYHLKQYQAKERTEEFDFSTPDLDDEAAEGEEDDLGLGHDHGHGHGHRHGSFGGGSGRGGGEGGGGGGWS